MTTTPNVSAEVEAAISRYRPTSVAPDKWAAVSDVARDAVRAAEPADAQIARTLLVLAAQFSAWTHEHNHTPLDPALLYVDELIDQWMDTAPEKFARSRPQVRSQLRRLNPAPRPAARPAHLDPNDPAAIAARISNYRPASIDAAVWGQIAEKVRDAVTRIEPVSTRVASGALITAARYLAWCTRQPGMPLTTATVWSDGTIERYVATLTGSRGTVRSQLRRIGRHTAGAAVAPKPPGYARAGRPKPYTPLQQTMLEQAAQAQYGKPRRRAFTALLALTVGAGIGRDELRGVLGTDVHTHVDGTCLVAVRNGQQPRNVVVDDHWAAHLRAAAADVKDRPLVGGRPGSNRNRVATLIDDLDLDTQLQPLTATRLRDTWIANQMIAGTPLPAIMHQAGLKTLHSLSTIAEQLTVSDDDARQLLRRPRASTPPEADEGDPAGRQDVA